MFRSLVRGKPHLRLYTSGKECSLCEEARAAIESIRKEKEFELETYNIKDDNLQSVEYWREMYKYDVPVLHLDEEEVMRHRIDLHKLKGLLSS